MTEVEVIRYPSSRFGKDAKRNLFDDRNTEIVISGWRGKLIARALIDWPNSMIRPSDPTRQQSLAWTISNLIFPSLLVIHWAYLRSGYLFSSLVDEGEVIFKYRKNGKAADKQQDEC